VLGVEHSSWWQKDSPLILVLPLHVLLPPHVSVVCHCVHEPTVVQVWSWVESLGLHRFAPTVQLVEHWHTPPEHVCPDGQLVCEPQFQQRPDCVHV
jgi:hypothetical protein